jgi:hypothetical protein
MRGQRRRWKHRRLLAQPRDDDADPATWSKQSRHLGQIEVRGAEVVIGVDADDEVKLFVPKREAVSLTSQRCHLAGHARGHESLPVLSRRDPPVDGDDLNTVLTGQEHRGEGLAAAKVEYEIPWTRGSSRTEGLEQPQRVWAHVVLQNPLGLVLIRTRELAPGQPVLPPTGRHCPRLTPLLPGRQRNEQQDRAGTDLLFAPTRSPRGHL